MKRILSALHDALVLDQGPVTSEVTQRPGE